MKKLNLMLLMCILFLNLANAVTPPAAVQKAFQEKFPTATNVKWGKENANNYEAEFKLDGKKVSANFSSKGVWLETETEFPVADLPEAVVNTIQKKFGGWKIIGVEKIESSKKAIRYEVNIKSGLKKKEVVLYADGKLTK